MLYKLQCLILPQFSMFYPIVHAPLAGLSNQWHYMQGSSNHGHTWKHLQSVSSYVRKTHIIPCTNHQTIVCHESHNKGQLNAPVDRVGKQKFGLIFGNDLEKQFLYLSYRKSLRRWTHCSVFHFESPWWTVNLWHNGWEFYQLYQLLVTWKHNTQLEKKAHIFRHPSIQLKHSQQCRIDKPAECSERIQHHSRTVHVPVVVNIYSTESWVNRLTDNPPTTLAFGLKQV